MAKFGARIAAETTEVGGRGRWSGTPHRMTRMRSAARTPADGRTASTLQAEYVSPQGDRPTAGCAERRCPARTRGTRGVTPLRVQRGAASGRGEIAGRRSTVGV